MKFVADESVDYALVLQLRRLGHEIFSVSELSPSIPDEQVLKLANKHKAILITADKDFGELVFRQKLAATGVVLVRVFGLPEKFKLSIVIHAISQSIKKMPRHFTVINPGQVRIRPQLG